MKNQSIKRQIDPTEAPPGFYAALKSEAKQGMEATFAGPAEHGEYTVTELVALVPNLSGIKTPIDIFDLVTDDSHAEIVQAIIFWEHDND